MTYQWSVFRAGLDPVAGREQAGERPVIVVSAEPMNEVYEVVTVVPVTRRKAGRNVRLGEVLLPDGTAGLPHESIALCYQLRAIDKSRLFSTYGEVADDRLKHEIAVQLLDCLDLRFTDELLTDIES